jgi:Tfp pilus assembly protein PilN
MRPVDLRPEDERRGPGVRKARGPLAYVVVGGLVALLAGVTLLVITNNSISSDKAEITQLEGEISAANAHAAELAPYVQLREVHDQRVATVTSLADSRFDWERVLRELSLILPDDISLTSLIGTVTPGATVGGAGGVSLRGAVPGPALELIGCAKGQDGVAEFVTALKEFDGVTRVGVESSTLAGEAEGATSDSAGTSGSCESGAQFQMVAAFDAAPISVTASEGE